MPLIFLKTPLSPEKEAMLRVMDRVANGLEFRYFIVGATARDLLMYHVHGFPVPRASPDIDFAMAIENWDVFKAVKDALLREPGFNENPKVLHRLHYSPLAGDGFPVDLVPFGGVEISPAQLAWPPDMKIVMNVVGYAEALESAVSIHVADGLVVPVASIPGLVMTKLIAWLDRGHANAKDAADVRYLLENYADAGNVDRLYGEEVFLLAACDYMFERASPRLLGLDVASIASVQCKRQIVSIVTTPALRDRFLVNMLQGKHQQDDAYGRLSGCLDEFATGLTASSAS